LVYERLLKTIEARKAHLTLIDPDKQPPLVAGRIACEAERAGTDGIMIGGSTATDGSVVEKTCQAVRERCTIPTILFPGSPKGLTDKADAVFYISLLNSRDPYFITGAHAQSARILKKLGVEVISVGYIIVEPGQTVGRLGRARLIPRDRPDLASAYAMVAEFFGMKCVYLEAGSGAERPVPAKLIEAVKDSVKIPLIVGGGVRTVEDARLVADAGADIVVQGSAVEEDSGANRRVAAVIEYLRSGAPPAAK